MEKNASSTKISQFIVMVYYRRIVRMPSKDNYWTDIEIYIASCHRNNEQKKFSSRLEETLFAHIRISLVL